MRQKPETTKRNSMDSYQEISNKAIFLCKLVLKMTTHAGSGHPSSSLSIAHIITALMYKIMKYDLNDPWNPANDRLVLSEGHAVPLVYAAYADLNGVWGVDQNKKQVLTIDDLFSLRQINSPLDGHPNPSTGFPFFDCATGSLGQGLSCACGLAISARAQGIKKKVYVIIGDGESREGQIWEACDFIIDHGLTEVIPVFNCNGLGQTGSVSKQQSPQNLASKLKAFGFDIRNIDGHNPVEILESFQQKKGNHPFAVLAKTVKGWGVELLKGDNHGKPVSKKTLDQALSDLDSLKTCNHDTNRVKVHPSSPQKIKNLPEKKLQLLPDPDFYSLLENDPYLSKYQKGLMSTRRAFGLALKESGQINNQIFVLDADVSNSTFTEYFSKSCPERFIQCFIGEQNMISVAAGLSKSNYIPFVASFAKFLVRGYDQLELALIAEANIKLCGSHVGINIGADGPSQMGITDLGYMRTLSTVHNNDGEPLIVILNPACAVAAYKFVQLMTEHKGCCYLRLIRQDLPLLYLPSEKFEFGGAKLLRKGKDVAIMATGYMVHACIKVVEELVEAGISPSLYDCYSIPVNPQTVTEAALENGGKIVTVEDNYGNGLGTEIASIVSSDPSIKAVVKQLYAKRIPKSGILSEDVLDFAGIGV